MTDFDYNLSKRLLYLPLSILSRVEIWLTYRDLKGSSVISARQTFNEANSATRRIIKWIRDANLTYCLDTVDSTLIHVSKNQEQSNKMAMLQWSKTEKDITYRGLAYGYPEEAVRIFNSDHDKLTAIRIDDILMSKYYWKPYIRYMVRKGKEYEDSLIAKKWADLIRSENPVLAKWFEAKLN